MEFFNLIGLKENIVDIDLLDTFYLTLMKIVQVAEFCDSLSQRDRVGASQANGNSKKMFFYNKLVTNVLSVSFY